MPTTTRTYVCDLCKTEYSTTTTEDLIHKLDERVAGEDIVLSILVEILEHMESRISALEGRKERADEGGRTETQTYQSAPWDPEGPDKNGLAHVWGSDGDLVATVVENLAYEESHMDRARLIAAAPDYDKACRKPRDTQHGTDLTAPELLRLAGGRVKGDIAGACYDLAEDLEDAMDKAQRT